MILDDYLGLIPPANAHQPDFMAVLGALLQPMLDTQQVIGGLNQDFDLDTAIGAQLDVDGLWIGRSRFISTPISNVYFSWDTDNLGWEQGYWQGAFDPDDGVSRLDDETYRKLLYAKAAANVSDGSTTSIIDIVNKLVDGEGVSATVFDNQDMTMRLEIHGVVQNLLLRSIITGGYLPIKPVGVKLNYLVVDSVQFPVSSTITGFGGVQVRVGLVFFGSSLIHGTGGVSLGGFVAVFSPFSGLGGVNVRAVVRAVGLPSLGEFSDAFSSDFTHGIQGFGSIQTSSSDRRQPISASVASVGAVQASAIGFTPSPFGGAVIGGQVAVVSSASHTPIVAANIAGSAATTPTAVTGDRANATVAGAGSISVPAIARELGKATVAGAGSISVPAIARELGKATVAGAGSLTATVGAKTFNIHIGLTVWINHTFALNERCSNAGNAYQCITAGTSSVAPTGTSANSAPGGTAHFKWLSAIDYTAFQTYADARESPRTFDHDVIVWNDSLIQCVADVQLLYLSDNTTGAYKTTIRAAPGDSVRDNATGTYDATKGVAIQLPVSTDTDITYIYIEAPNVTFDGIQFKNPRQTGQSTPLTMTGANSSLRNCIFDVYGRVSVKNVELAAPNPTVANCLFLDRHTTAAQNLIGVTTGVCNIVNSDFIAVVPGAGTAQAIYIEDTIDPGRHIRNCMIFGWSGAEPIWASAANIITADHCVTDSANMGDITVDGGNNLVSKVLANQVVSITTDFRLKTGADCINAGVTDLTNIPTGDDILKKARTTSPDVGCFEF